MVTMATPRMPRTLGKGGFTNETCGRRGGGGNLVFLENLENILQVCLFILFWLVVSILFLMFTPKNGMIIQGG